MSAFSYHPPWARSNLKTGMGARAESKSDQHTEPDLGEEKRARVIVKM